MTPSKARKLSTEKRSPLFSQIAKLNSDNNAAYVNITSYINLDPKQPFKKSISGDDDSVLNCEELRDPKVNYYDLDFRKRGTKPQSKLFGTFKIPKMKHLDIFRSPKIYFWRERSLTPDSLDYLSRRQTVLYADLILQHHSADKLTSSPKRSLESRDSDVQYSEIDFEKTKALEEADREFKKSKSRNKASLPTMHSMVSLYQRFSKKISK